MYFSNAACELLCHRRNEKHRIVSMEALVHVSSVTIHEYYHNTLEKSSNLLSHLCKGYLGKSRGALDLMDLDINLVVVFGSFIKYVANVGGPMGGAAPVVD